MAKPGEEKAGMEAINKLKSTDPPLYLSPNSNLSVSSRKACQYLFSCLKPYSPKSPFDKLHTDGFDAEQIWQQLDLQSLPIISSLKREIKRFEKNPDQISNIFGKSEANRRLEREIKDNGEVGLEGDSEEFEGLSDAEDEDEGEERENGVGGEIESGDDEEDDDDESGEEEEDDEGSGEDEEDDGDGVPEIEDDFLKIKELEKYLVREEEREYGSDEEMNKKKKLGTNNVHAPKPGAHEDDDESEAGEENDELLMYAEGDDDEDEPGDNVRYQDFFVPDKKVPKRKWKQADKSDDSEMEDEDDKQENMSTYEKERLKIQAKIKEMEEANLKPKEWTMQGEVIASKRPKDSALEVDLDFEHNVRPPPVITEEVTASLEEIIKQRISEGNFDDVQRAPKLPSVAPKERKELDDNKSKKGLAEIYEEEYAQQTGLSSGPVSFNDELKKEANILFKRLCLKLDALSHFHFAPKPVVEDMAVQSNVPALAMEEIAPVAVSDAAMLAPEEVFAGKGDINEETELTKEDKKRRRARKKRKTKAINAKRTVNRATEKPSLVQSEGKEQ